MKILYIVPQLYYGGAELQMRRLIKVGISLGYDIKVLDIETSEEIDEEYKVIQMKKNILLTGENKIFKILKRIIIYFSILKESKKENYDYIIFFNILFLPLVFFLKSKIVFSVREYNPRYFKKFCIYFKKIDILTANNIPSFIEMKKKYKKVFLQNNIIDFYKVETQENSTKKSYLVVSNISEHKNILPVIDTFLKLKDKGYKLKIAGKISDKKYYNTLLEKIKQNNNIEFLGYLKYEDLIKKYNEVEGIIHLSKMEGTPNAILDAIKFKKKFICLNTVENICLFNEIQNFFITKEEELENKILELEERDCSYELDYLNKKLKLMFSEQNAIEFYKFLERDSE